jgi:hypothetical protein
LEKHTTAGVLRSYNELFEILTTVCLARNSKEYLVCCKKYTKTANTKIIENLKNKRKILFLNNEPSSK